MNRQIEINAKASWKQKTAIFLGGQAITLFGSSLVQFAIIWYIAKTTQSGLMVTLSTACSFLPQVIISLFAGVLADRHNRKILIIIADASIAVATLVLAIFMMSSSDFLWAMLLISVIRSVGTGVQTPAVNALIPQLVPEDKLMKVNGINGSIQSIINLAAPAVAGVVLSYNAVYNIMFIDVVTAIIGITILYFLPMKTHQKAMELDNTSFFSDLKAGLKYSYQHSFIKRLILINIIYTILIVPAGFLNVLMVTRVFGDSYWYLMINEMVFFVGATVGGLILGAMGGFKNHFSTLGFGIAAFGTLTFAIGFIHNFWIYIAVMLLVGVSMPFANSPFMVLIQERVEYDMQGRMFSLMQIAFSAFMPLGMAIFGPMADVMPIQWLIISSGVALVVLAIFIWVSSFRSKE